VMSDFQSLLASDLHCPSLMSFPLIARAGN
jgi:hypothetical protein